MGDDDSCSLTMRSNDWYGLKWLNVDLPNRASISDTKDVVSVILVFVTWVSRSK